MVAGWPLNQQHTPVGMALRMTCPWATESSGWIHIPPMPFCRAVFIWSMFFTGSEFEITWPVNSILRSVAACLAASLSPLKYSLASGMKYEKLFGTGGFDPGVVLGTNGLKSLSVVPWFGVISPLDADGEAAADAEAEAAADAEAATEAAADGAADGAA